MGRSGMVRSRRIAEKGTGTWGVLQIMNAELKVNPGDVDAASVVCQMRAKNLGLCYGPCWDEHGAEWSKGMYTKYVQPFDETPKVVPPDLVQQPTPVPRPFINSFDGDETEEPEPEPEPTFPEQKPEILIGASAKRYFLAGEGKVSQEKEIGLWTHEDILAKIGYFEVIVTGSTHSLEMWTALLALVPLGGMVKDYVTNEQLREFDL